MMLVSKPEENNAAELKMSSEDIQPPSQLIIPNERLQPLGATSSPEPSHSKESYSDNYIDYEDEEDDEKAMKYKELMKENENLNSSLFSLTSHFAQVQFRLEQVVHADASDKDELLSSLKEFASRGVPDLRVVPSRTNNDSVLSDELSQKDEQLLINQIKTQLNDLESFAYNNGKLSALPTNEQIKRQRLIIEKLREKLNLNLNDCDVDNMSENELSEAVELAIDEIVCPMRSNEKLVEQLKTQIIDLERFIDFLHDQVIRLSECK